MKIYFAGAIRGGRERVEDYSKIVKKLQEFGEVLTVHVANPELCDSGEKNMSMEEIYNRDVEWLKQSDLIIAEVSIPSLGIGYELGLAERLEKRVICFYDKNADKSLSAMIGGNKKFEIVRYDSVDEVILYLDNLK